MDKFIKKIPLFSFFVVFIKREFGNRIIDFEFRNLVLEMRIVLKSEIILGNDIIQVFALSILEKAL